MLGRRSERVPFSIKTCECRFPVDRCHGAKEKSLSDIFLKSGLKGISPERPERFSFNDRSLSSRLVGDTSRSRGTQREYNSKSLKDSIVKRILVFKR